MSHTRYRAALPRAKTKIDPERMQQVSKSGYAQLRAFYCKEVSDVYQRAFPPDRKPVKAQQESNADFLRALTRLSYTKPKPDDWIRTNDHVIINEK